MAFEYLQERKLHFLSLSDLCCRGTLLAPCQPGSTRTSDALFCQAAFQQCGPQHVLVNSIVHSQVQDFVLLHAELHEAPVSPLFQPIKDPLDGSTTLWCISHSSQFRTISKLADSILWPNIQIIRKWTGLGPLLKLSYWPPTRLIDTDYYPLGLAIQPVFNPPQTGEGLFIWSIIHQLLNEDVIGNGIENLTEVKVENTVFPFSTKSVMLLWKVVKLAKHDFPLMNTCFSPFQ